MMSASQDLEKLDTLRDDELWAIVERHLSSIDENHLHYLGSEEKRASLTREEQNQFDQLLAQVNHDMLRSKALLLLKERGHDITHFLKT